MAKRKGPMVTELPLRLITDLALPDGITLPAGTLVSVITTWTPGTFPADAPTRTIRYLPSGAYAWQRAEVTLPAETLEAATGKGRGQLL